MRGHEQPGRLDLHEAVIPHLNSLSFFSSSLTQSLVLSSLFALHFTSASLDNASFVERSELIHFS
jgi:hypothetical protein